MKTEDFLSRKVYIQEKFKDRSCLGVHTMEGMVIRKGCRRVDMV
jgi:hypothetical protein